METSDGDKDLLASSSYGLEVMAYAASRHSEDNGTVEPSELSKDCQLLHYEGGGLSQLNFSQLTDYGLSQSSSLEPIENGDTNTPSDITLLKSSLTKEEMPVVMKGFNPNDSSSHLFLKTCQGTLHDWEYPSRRFFYLDIIRPMLNDLNAKGSRLVVKKSYDEVCLKYMSVTGANRGPPFYIFDKVQNIYTCLNDEETRKYVKSLFSKMDRVTSTISRYESIANSKLKTIPAINNVVSSLYVFMNSFLLFLI